MGCSLNFLNGGFIWGYYTVDDYRGSSEGTRRLDSSSCRECIGVKKGFHLGYTRAI